MSKIELVTFSTPSLLFFSVFKFNGGTTTTFQTRRNLKVIPEPLFSFISIPLQSISCPCLFYPQVVFALRLLLPLYPGPVLPSRCYSFLTSLCIDSGFSPTHSPHWAIFFQNADLTRPLKTFRGCPGLSSTLPMVVLTCPSSCLSTISTLFSAWQPLGLLCSSGSFTTGICTFVLFPSPSNLYSAFQMQRNRLFLRDAVS